MASFKGRFAERQLLDLEFSQTAFGVAVPATQYFALFTTLPAADGTGGVEVSGSNYSRAAFTNNGTNWPAASGSNPATKSNAVAITFPVPSGAWGTVVGFGYYDAASSGNLWRAGTLSASVAPLSGNTVLFQISAVTVTEN